MSDSLFPIITFSKSYAIVNNLSKLLNFQKKMKVK
ncbi:hypothetical protein SAMN05444266_106265 [Chitinophaga jiangningensis]|uniref:Uncharacterized protein n=1 Tax=Chitinophaga jiangningensis TaxID=1419482 RepID=A0A1M7FTS2_9BACT|nr:hypothetical protein SAMN05444266_106265 [Chitinophaga jiangningensis]